MSNKSYRILVLIIVLSVIAGGIYWLEAQKGPRILSSTKEAARAKSEETYFGSARDSLLGSGIPGLAGLQTMPAPKNMRPNFLYLTGQWDFQAEYAESKSAGAVITYIYNAKNVYLVASSPAGVRLNVLLDGKPLGTVLVKEERLYKIVAGKDYGEHTLEITVETPGLRAYTFTFG
jgi:hypothetical protein